MWSVVVVFVVVCGILVGCTIIIINDRCVFLEGGVLYRTAADYEEGVLRYTQSVCMYLQIPQGIDDVPAG